MDFDIDALDTVTLSEEGVEMVVRDAYNEPVLGPDGKPITIILAGPDSRAARQADTKAERAVQEAMRRNKPMPGNRTLELDKAVAITMNWRNVTAGGKPIPCNPSNARALYEARPAILRQVLEFHRTEANFTKASGTGSSHGQDINSG